MTRRRYFPSFKALGQIGPGLFALLLTAAASTAYSQDTPPPAASTAGPVAAAFNVSPLRIEMPRAADSSVFQVTNSSDAPLSLQLRVFDWTQTGGEDRYAAAQAIAISPAIVQMEPGATQIFRAVRRPVANAAAPRTEKSFRVIIDQLPDRNAAAAGAAMTRLRLSVPLFADSDQAAAAQLVWSATGGMVLARNDGGRSAKISRLALSTRGAETAFAGGGPRYVLAGSDKGWPLPAPLTCIAAESELVGVIDGKAFRASVPATC